MPTTPSDDAPRRTTGGFVEHMRQRGFAVESGARPAPGPDPNHNRDGLIVGLPVTEAPLFASTVEWEPGERVGRAGEPGFEWVNDAMAPREHPHAGRIAAVAHLSTARALIDCAFVALEEHDLLPADSVGPYIDTNVRDVLDAFADEIMEPCEVANVLRTVEETIATMGLMPGPPRAGVTGTWVSRDGRARIVQALIDVRAAGKDDEACLVCGATTGDACTCTSEPVTRACCDTEHGERHHHECSEAEPTDDEIYNRPGVEGGIPYPIDHANYREDT